MKDYKESNKDKLSEGKEIIDKNQIAQKSISVINPVIIKTITKIKIKKKSIFIIVKNLKIQC